MINFFMFRCADPETQDYNYYFVYQLTGNKSPNCQYNKGLSCLCLRKNQIFYPKNTLGLGAFRNISENMSSSYFQLSNFLRYITNFSMTAARSFAKSIKAPKLCSLLSAFRNICENIKLFSQYWAIDKQI